MLRQIDRTPTHLIQKVCRPDGSLVAYQTVPLHEGKPVHNYAKIDRFGTLAEARGHTVS